MTLEGSRRGMETECVSVLRRVARLSEADGGPVQVLDGDLVRDAEPAAFVDDPPGLAVAGQPGDGRAERDGVAVVVAAFIAAWVIASGRSGRSTPAAGTARVVSSGGVGVMRRPVQQG